MKSLVALLLSAFCSLAGAQVPWSIIMQVEDGSATFNRTYFVGPPSQDALIKYNNTTAIPEMLNLGTAGATVVSAATAADVRAAISAFALPSGSTAQYLRGDGTLATFPAIPAAFAYGFPSARTLAVSTAYQATDPSKAAVLTVSPLCTNATTVVAASACTLQVRMNTATLNCSGGTVYSTWTSTYALGLLLTNTSGSSLDIKLPASGWFILCPTAGTFTLAAVEQTVG